MTFGLKATFASSICLAILLNLCQFAFSYNRHAQAAFAPSWVDTPTTSASGPSAAPARVRMQPVSPVSVPMTLPAQAPVPTSAASPVDIVQSKLLANGLKPNFASSYIDVQTKTGTPWQLLAAVHATETSQSGNTSRKSVAGATGPMQFMPSTFAYYALDGDGNGTKDITNFDDALLTAGHYLAVSGASKGNYAAALFNYNHSAAYVSHVSGIAMRLGL